MSEVMPDVPRVGGWLEDAPSGKDLPFGLVAPAMVDLASTLVDYEHIIPEFTPVSYQGRLGSCVGNGCVDALEIIAGIQDPDSVVQLSRLHAYWNSRYFTGTTDRDEGTQIRSCIYQMSVLGVSTEALWPYDDDPSPDGPVFKSPPMKAIMTANSNKVTSFYRIDSFGEQRLDDIELAIRANHPVVYGTPVSRAFTQLMNVCEEGFPRPLEKDFVGRHCMIITGVRKVANGRRKLLTRNSWGWGWALNGHAWLDQNYIDWEETRDLWVPTKMARLNLYG